jgi:pimeloyl-ACP methyl ester carboxylesterase
MAQTPSMLSPLVHDRKGAGETVVLIHGIGHRRQAWDPVFDRLAERYDVIRIDLAGFGESPAYPAGTPYNMDNACADLTANFAAWGVERPHVVGNSLGGAISLELAARGLVSSATVLSPAGFFGRVERLWPLIMLSLLKVASQLPDRFLHWNSRSRLGRFLAGYLLYVHPERTTTDGAYGDARAMKRAPAFYQTILAGVRYELDASGLTVPTTVAWGTKDRLLWPRQARVARRRIPNAHHVPLPGCGHVPMIDDPSLIIDVIDQTVSRAGQSKAA